MQAKLWWLVPSIFTVLVYVIAWAKVPAAQPSSYIPDMAPAFLMLAYGAIATIASLLAWLTFFIIF